LTAPPGSTGGLHQAVSIRKTAQQAFAWLGRILYSLVFVANCLSSAGFSPYLSRTAPPHPSKRPLRPRRAHPPGSGYNDRFSAKAGASPHPP
jgi:hypothetical protein